METNKYRLPTNHHMGRRLPKWDYRREGYYVITIVLADRKSAALGRLIIEAPTENPLPEEISAKVELSALGEAVLDHFKRIGEFTEGLQPIYAAIMPDHIHLLLHVNKPLKRPIGNAIAGFKAGCNKLADCSARAGEKLADCSARAGEKLADCSARAGEKLFADGFVDEVVLRKGQLANEFAYLKDNPRRLAIKRLFPELFKVSREIKLADCSARAGESLRFSGIGNHFLLEQRFCQVQVSRSILPGTPEYEAKRDSIFARAKYGEVLISPCISKGERQIARDALEAGYRLVVLRNRGFSPLYKPGGKFFDACAEGRLLMLAPIAWPYQVQEKPITRVDALILNRICQIIAGENAAEINYRGATIEDCDKLVWAACGAIGKGYVREAGVFTRCDAADAAQEDV